MKVPSTSSLSVYTKILALWGEGTFYVITFCVHELWGEVPSTSSLSVYTKVLAHNLNDIRNWASLTGLLFRICWCLLSIFSIYCSGEWKKLVNLIYCFQVLFRMNFKIMYFLMKSWEIPPPQTVQHLGIPFLLKMQHEVLFFLLILWWGIKHPNRSRSRAGFTRARFIFSVFSRPMCINFTFLYISEYVVLVFT